MGQTAMNDLMLATSALKLTPETRIATAYDKLAANYLAFIKLASIRIWLRTCGSTHWPPAC